MGLWKRLAEFSRREISDKAFRAILAIELVSSVTLLFFAFEVLPYERYYLSIILFAAGCFIAACTFLMPIFSIPSAIVRWPLALGASAGSIVAMIYVMGVVSQAEREFYDARVSANVALAKQAIDNRNAGRRAEEAPPADKPKGPTHHAGEGFLRITEAPGDPQNVYAVGTPVSFNVAATNTGQEAVTNVLMFSSLQPMGEIRSRDNPKADTESDMIKQFHEARDIAIAQQAAAGYKGVTLGAGENQINRIGTHEQTLNESSVKSLYAQKSRFYVLSWVSWKTLNGIKMEDEVCVWLEPPDPPNTKVDKLWWNGCDPLRKF
jgi:hypothetical protein